MTVNIREQLSAHVDEVNKWCRENGFIRTATFAIGSWNYNLGEETSDVDTRSFVIPTLEHEILQPNWEGTTIKMPNSDELCSIVEFRNGIRSFKKQCITALEVLFSQYSNVNGNFYYGVWEELFKNNEQIALYDGATFLKAQLGYIQSMLKREGGKAVMHMVRTAVLLERLSNWNMFKDTIYCSSPERDMLLCVKHNATKEAEIREAYKQWVEKRGAELAQMERYKVNNKNEIDILLKQVMLEAYQKVW